MRRITVVAALGCLALLWPQIARASCAQRPPLRQALGEAQTAFVGTVEAVTDRSRTATVRVESIWLGAGLPEVVEVIGRPSTCGRGCTSSVDRTFEPDTRYLFVLSDDSAPFRDNACSSTTEYGPQVAALTPEGAIGPETPRTGMWLLVLAVLVAAGIWQARRARRRTQEITV